MKEQFLKNAQAAFLRDTIQFYNSDNLGMTDWSCIYRATERSPGCAIGRHILNKDRCKDMDGWGGLANWDSDRLIELGPILALGRAFLERVQNLHDDFAEENWCPEGLTKKGRESAEKICSDFGLDRLAVFSSQTHPAE
jgi:hypothetical protein